MARDGSGIYDFPAGSLAVPNTVIESAKFNAFANDIKADLNLARPITAGGSGGATLAAAQTNLHILDSAYATARVATIAALRALDSTLTFAYVTTEGYYDISAYVDGVRKGGGRYFHDAADVTTADNNSTVIVNGTKRWKLQHGGKIETTQCGCYVDGSTDDLAAYNRAVALINTAANNIDTLIFPPGIMDLSDNLNPFTTGTTFSLLGAGPGASVVRFRATATNKGNFITLGDATNTAQNILISGIGFSNSLNDTTLTGTDAAIYLRNCTYVVIENCNFTSCVRWLKCGADSVDEHARRVRVKSCLVTPRNVANIPVIELIHATAFNLSQNYCSQGSVTVASSRLLRIAPTANSTGVDSVTLMGNEFNWNSADLDYLVEIDVTLKGVSNFVAHGNVLDGGSIANFWVRLDAGAGATSAKRLHNMIVTGNRIAANGAGAAAVGVCLKISQASDNLLSGINFTGNMISGAGALICARSGGALDGFVDAVFNGNSIINANTVNNGTVFETDCGGLSITGNTLAHQTEDNTNRFANFFKANTANGGKNLLCANNTIGECSSASGFDLAAWGAGDFDQTVIKSNRGKAEASIRVASTTDATVTTLANMTLANGSTYRIRAIVQAAQGNTNRAAYTVNAVASATAGVATLHSGAAPTADYESNAAWNCTVDASGATIRVQVTGAAAANIDWGLADVTVMRIG